MLIFASSYWDYFDLSLAIKGDASSSKLPSVKNDQSNEESYICYSFLLLQGYSIQNTYVEKLSNTSMSELKVCFMSIDFMLYARLLLCPSIQWSA